MLPLRIVSVAEPLRSDPAAARAAAHLVARAQYVGVLPPSEAALELGTPLLASVLAGLAARGVARDADLGLRTASSAQEIRQVIASASADLELSPLPEGTWPVLADTLGEELLRSLLGISPMSMRRYARGERGTPGAVAARLHFLALLVADLSGAYNDYGIRRWFQRPRFQLDGATPLSLMQGLDPDGEAATSVRRLVDGLVGAGAA